MSGIFGCSYLDKDSTDNQRDIELLKKWHLHYGNEGTYHISEPKFNMGCCINHLSDDFPAPKSILRSKNSCAVMDTLLFNRQELINKLYTEPDICMERKTALSDEDLLFEVYQKLGKIGLKEVNGDFAGAVYNSKKGELTLLANHLGTRPLFYYFDETKFVFATDYRAILSLPGIDKSLDEELLYRRIRSMNCLESERTLYKNIKIMKPAHILKYDGKGKPKLEAYWKLGSNKVRFSSDSMYIKRMRELIEDSIKRRMNVYTGPIGGELSGGLDSSVIDILISITGRESYFHTWSPSLNKHELQENDERIIIDAVCEKYGLTFSFNDSDEPYNPMTHYYPYDNNTPAIALSMRYFKKNNAKIAFSGWGGDEGVSHRASMLELWRHKEYFSYFREVFHRANSTKNKLKIPFRIVKILYAQIKAYNRILKPWQAENSEGETVQDIASSSFYERIDGKHKNKALLFAVEPIVQIESGGNRHRCHLAAWRGANEGVQYVFPFLDYRVEDYAVSIPRRLFYQKGKNRYIFIQAFTDIMPLELVKYASKSDPGRISFLLSKKENEVFDEISKMRKFLDENMWSEYINLSKVDEMMEAYKSEKYQLRDYISLNKVLQICYNLQRLNTITSKTPKDLDMLI